MVARAITVYGVDDDRRSFVSPLFSLVRRCECCTLLRWGFFRWGWEVQVAGGPTMNVCKGCARDQLKAAEVCRVWEPIVEGRSHE
jgi:hypothetical protein